MIGAVHVVTDAGCGRCTLDQARAAARGGAWAVQLRDKHASDAQLAVQARRLLACLAPFGTRLIINDRVELACAVGAHGVHIGQRDGDPGRVRRRIGPRMLLGLSIEHPSQVRQLPRDTVDYIGVGPVRQTASKPDHAPPLGLAGLARTLHALPQPLPAIAIGGLGIDDVPALIAAGATGMAVVSAVSRSHAPRATTRALVAAWATA